MTGNNNAIVPTNRNIVRPMLYGAVVVGNVTGLIIALLSVVWVDDLVLSFIFGTLGSASVGAVIAWIKQRTSNTSINKVQQELNKLQALRQQELLNQHEYEQLKAGIIDAHSIRLTNRQTYDWRIPFWTGIFGMSVIVTGFSQLLALLGALAGALIVGIGATSVGFVQRMVIGQPPAPQSLPEPHHWEQLGSRE